MKKNCVKKFLGLVLMVVGLAMPNSAFAQDWTGTAFSTGMASTSAPVYFYNVGAKAWLINAGNWGTQASTNKDYGIPFVGVTGSASSANLKTGLETNEGVWLGFTQNSAWDNERLFCDRGGNGSTPSDSYAVMNFKFTAVEGSENNEYNISFTYKSNTYYVSAEAESDSISCATSLNGDYSKWIIVTTQTINEKLQQAPADLKNPTNITYTISDAGLVRGSSREGQWTSTLTPLTSGSTTADGLQLGAQYYYKTAPAGSYSYTTSPDYSAEGYYVQAKGKYFGAQVKGAKGKFSQTFKVYYSGWYQVSCQGFYYNADKEKNEVASLYVTAEDDTRKTALALGTLEGAVPESWDAAAVELYGRTRYKNSVMIKVMMDNANDKGYDANGKEITIGIDFDETNAAFEDWTVFDDFQIEFLGLNTELVLKENNLDYNYLFDTEEEYKNATLWLNRTFSVDSWNTLVLPVALNKGQFVTAFGSNARAAELISVEQGILKFQTLKKTGKEDTDAFLEANKPYIVYITQAPDRTQEFVVSLTHKVSGEMVEVEVGGKDCPYYAIPFVTLDKEDVADEHGAISGAYTFEDGDASITFNGTYLKTYEGTAIRDGFSDMVGNIIFKGGELYWLTDTYGMKAYRAWLEPNGYTYDGATGGGSGDADGGTKLSVSIDGVEDAATYIHDLTIGNENTSAQKYQSGVYGINGQLMNVNANNLPKGVYIVNGKKYIVK